MGRFASIFAAAAFLIMAIALADIENKSASVWSTTTEEGDLLAWNSEADNDTGELTTLPDDQDLQLDGGFSSLVGMLQWAIGHSDPAKLKEATLGIERLSPEELQERQMELKELMEKLKTPSDAELMKIAIDDLNNLSLSVEGQHRALQELLILVEPIDNANDLHKLGGLTAVIRELNHSNSEIRTVAAWVLGKASQNNPFVQNQILELETLPRLVEMVHSDFNEEATKALYAISALIRNNPKGQELFYTVSGDLMIQNILSDSSIDIRLRRKSVFLLADMVECQLHGIHSSELPFFSNHLLLKSVVDMMASSDLDLQEKALYAVKNLLLLRSTDALIFRDVCKLESALQRMELQLQQLMADDNFKELAQDVENLRKAVEEIYLRNLLDHKDLDTKQFPHDQ